MVHSQGSVRRGACIIENYMIDLFKIRDVVHALPNKKTFKGSSVFTAQVCVLFYKCKGHYYDYWAIL